MTMYSKHSNVLEGFIGSKGFLYMFLAAANFGCICWLDYINLFLANCPFSVGFSCRGYNIGVRLIDEFLAKSNVSRCVDFKETAEVIAKVWLLII